jgi:hypothetical protein
MKMADGSCRVAGQPVFTPDAHVTDRITPALLPLDPDQSAALDRKMKVQKF